MTTTRKKTKAMMTKMTSAIHTTTDEYPRRFCCSKPYWCPTVDEIECPTHGGFSTCCHAPELHEPLYPGIVGAVVDLHVAVHSLWSVLWTGHLEPRLAKLVSVLARWLR
jgi:hypothetical protein